MKTWITTAAIAALALLGATPNAEARDRHHHREYRHHMPDSHIYISGHRSCGTPIYRQRYCVGHDRYGRPIWRTRVVAAPRYYRSEGRPRYRSAPVCPPSYPSYGGYRRGGIVIQGGFRL
jgi:hypothetical protein